MVVSSRTPSFDQTISHIAAECELCFHISHSRGLKVRIYKYQSNRPGSSFTLTTQICGYRYNIALHANCIQQITAKLKENEMLKVTDAGKFSLMCRRGFGGLPV